MKISDAKLIYYVKTEIGGHLVDDSRSQLVSPRVVILKDGSGRRLACVVESKRGYVVDLVKKLHPMPAKNYGWCLRDAKGRFVKKTPYQKVIE